VHAYHRFNTSLDNVEWPRSLKKLSLSSSFNQSLEAVKWPPALEVGGDGRAEEEEEEEEEEGGN